ncbi:MAG TPA: biotin/lipoyl-binding protein, partial [Burkholderiaceae bacterium]|nr:biotin/lipoyl-binding protein [Burkholderiaceae bacterium]
MSDSKQNKTKNGTAKKRAKVIGALLVPTIAAGAVWYFLIRTPAGPQNVIKVSGRIEGDDATVASKIAGRIREIHVREGDQVKAGQVVALIDDEQVRAREEQHQSLVFEAEARVLSAEQQIAVLNAQLEESNIGVDQA